MKIYWTYIVNTRDKNKIRSIVDEILVNHEEAQELTMEIYWKDASKYHVAFSTPIEKIDLTAIMTHMLHKISHHWNFSISDDVADINAVTDKPLNFKVFWVSFSIVH